MTPVRKSCESWDCSAWRSKGSRWGGVLLMYMNIWKEGAERMELGSFQCFTKRMELGSVQCCTVTAPKATGTCWNTGSSEHRETCFHWEGDQALAQVDQRGCGVSVLGDTQKPSGHDSGHLASDGPSWAGGIVLHELTVTHRSLSTCPCYCIYKNKKGGCDSQLWSFLFLFFLACSKHTSCIWQPKLGNSDSETALYYFRVTSKKDPFAGKLQEKHVFL